MTSQRFPMRTQRWLMVAGALFALCLLAVGALFALSHALWFAGPPLLIGSMLLAVSVVLLVRQRVFGVVVDDEQLSVPRRLGGAPRSIPRRAIQKVTWIWTENDRYHGHLPRLRIDWDDAGTPRHVHVDHAVMRAQDFDALATLLGAPPAQR